MAFWWSAPVKPRNHPCSQLHLAQRTWQARLTSQLIGLIPQQSNLLPWHEAVNDKEQWQGDQLSLSFPGLFRALWKLRFGLFSPTGDLVGGVEYQHTEVLLPFAVETLSLLCMPSTPFSPADKWWPPLGFHVIWGKDTQTHGGNYIAERFLFCSAMELIMFLLCFI